ncbi:MAG: recombination mediator RecR [Acidimicrobiaceae bacterium]|nr:recombination mediator RecR [Acidimicrobiaceae bacterium]MCY4176293.1 recombination mediator RecR [Acidimicrobiaceae bacterium]MCY4280002.1 recombination mediator RecR [Acidimicrobiaceae bacterium]MCY4293546.1 recombination mediator RecR [Acidimicrobiaceae bacterium]
MSYSGAVQELIDQLGRLPGIGPKSAQRVAFYLLRCPPEDANRLAGAIAEAKARVSYCPKCFNLAEQGGLCAVCRDPARNPRLVCVVEDAQDVVAVERTGEFAGRYHVLQGAFSPIDGVGVDQLRLKELLERVTDEDITEVIVATNPNLEGEATAMLVHKYLKPAGVKVTRIASGLPVGGDLEYADELTLGRALEGRRSIEEPQNAR